jgi:effector-binding domain-containing protein
VRPAIGSARALYRRNIPAVLAALVVSLSPAAAHPLPQPGRLAFKHVPGQNILYVIHKGPGHIASSFAKLVAYYMKDSTPYAVVFPQMTVQISDTVTWVAIAYTGSAVASDEVRLGSLPQATVGSKVCRGSYQKLGQAIGEAYREIAGSKRYVPLEGAPPRLLYWNSPDDNHSAGLITEIQIPVVAVPVAGTAGPER